MKKDRFIWIKSVRTTWTNKVKRIAQVHRGVKTAETTPPRTPPRLSWVYKSAALAVVVLLVLGQKANGQFGIDIAAIVAALNKMQTLMNNSIATPLKTINQTQQNMAAFEQQVMYPVQQINQARSTVTQFEGQFHQVSNLFANLNVSSATLPQSQALESILLSRNAANINSVTPQYQSVYGTVMAQNTSSPTMRTMTDITDAQAQDAMKRALAIDALADAELKQADDLGQQIAQAAPGSAPILEAEADADLVRANAYTQAAIAELMRTRAVDLSNQSMIHKIGTTQTTGLGNFIQSANH
jgi:hypothetical protein